MKRQTQPSSPSLLSGGPASRIAGPLPSPAPAHDARARERENAAALAWLEWKQHVKRCRTCRLGEMGGIYGLCERGRRLGYAREFTRQQAQA